MTNDPTTDPVRDTGERSITASWLVGEPAADGWQARADLTVHHDKGSGYRATLKTLHQKRDDISTTMTLNFDVKRCATEIHTRPAARFNRKTLGEVYDNAVREVRQRFASGDETVTRYFDPDSAVYTYAGAPNRP